MEVGNLDKLPDDGTLIAFFFPINSMSVKTEYSKDELSRLTKSAKNLLGWQVIFHDLHIPADTQASIPQKILNTRGKVAVVISQIEFYPTQSTNWQNKVETNRLTGERTDRKPMQIYSDFSNANPLVSTVLQRGPRAKSDPLAVIKRVIAAFGKGDADEITWKKLLTDRRLGLQSNQLNALMNAMNFAQVLNTHSPVQLRKIQGIAGLPVDEQEPDTSAHGDLESKMELTEEAKQSLGVLLQRILEQEKST